jgi:thiosulfate/3-mercaptopyruvate sulfurtransferase
VDGVSALIAPAQLADRLGAPDLAVFDATLYLPNEGRNARAEHAAAHIPGARFFDVDEVADPDTDLPHMVPSPGRFARLMGAAGVGDASDVVFYDQRGLFSAARGWWLMRLFGHDRVCVLDGGLPAWRAAGLPTETGPVPPAEPRVFTPDLRAARLRGIGDMLDNLRTGAELTLDARSAARFAAAVPEPRPGMRGGHIPGAKNLPFTELLDASGRMLPPDALRTRFAAAGVDGSRPVATCCGSGVTAAVLTLGLHVAGLPEGALYDGSWTEWGGRADTPVET